MSLPRPRGALTSFLVDLLRGDPDDEVNGWTEPESPANSIHDDDAQLALWICYELVYGGFDEVASGWRGHPVLLHFRDTLEAGFVRDLRELIGDDLQVVQAHVRRAGARGAAGELTAFIEAWPHTDLLANYLYREASRAEFVEFLQLRSGFALREADRLGFVLPRQRSEPRFSEALEAAGLDVDRGGYVDSCPGLTLSMSNAASLFCMHGQHRPAALGHLAAFEDRTSVQSRRVSQSSVRLGFAGRVTAFFEDRVVAGPVDGQVIRRAIQQAVDAARREDLDGLLFGAAVCLALEEAEAQRTVGIWRSGDSALADPGLVWTGPT